MNPTSSIRQPHHRRSVARGGGLAALVLACGALGSAAPALAEQAAPKYPSSIAVLGASAATGYNSSPLPRAWGFRKKTAAWNRNVWATGDNPQVKSVYSRVLARNPAVKGNNFNLAVPESDVSGLLTQAQKAVLLKPTPELVVVHSGDHDIACDGSDPRRYKPFGAAFSRVLDVLAKGAPNARILVVSKWGLDRQHLDVIEQMTTAENRAANSEDGPCEAFDNESGALLPARAAYLERVISGYQAQLAASCARVSNCVYDRGALRRMVVVPADLTKDLEHLSVQGQRKAAAIAWSVLY